MIITRLIQLIKSRDTKFRIIVNKSNKFICQKRVLWIWWSFFEFEDLRDAKIKIKREINNILEKRAFKKEVIEKFSINEEITRRKIEELSKI